jgi:hypothetical protein
MRSKLAGHALQLLGYMLTFLGLGVSAAAFLLAGNYPTVPLWVFVTAAVVIGAPMMIAGGRIDGRGRGWVLGQSPERAAREYREKTVLMAFFLGFILAHSALVTAPLFARTAGLLNLSDAFIKVWLVGSLLILCAGRAWISRPLWQVIEARVRKRWTTLSDGRSPRQIPGP